jgi:Ran GTPase-activating protein (RanGAP) involved in mRNA processing and transport
MSGSPKAAGAALAGSTYLGGLRVLDLLDGASDSGLAVMVGAPLFRNLSTLVLRYVSVRRGMTALAHTTPTPRLRRLHWDTVRPGDAALRELVHSSLFEDLEELQLDRGEIRTEGIRILSERTEWRKVEQLSLAYNDLDEAAVGTLSSIAFPALRRLCLSTTRLTPPALLPLLAAPWISKLERLELLWNSSLGDRGIEALASSPGLANLRHLEVTGCGITAERVRALASSPHLGRLETLDLGNNTFGQAGWTALAEATGLPALTSLALGRTNPTAVGLARLARSPLAERLRRLELPANQLDGAALQTVVSSRLAGLKDLRLDWNPIGDEGARALARAPFRGLVRLDLASCGLGNEGVRALVDGHGFPELAILDLLRVRLSATGKKALLDWPRLSHLAYLSSGYSYGDPPEFLKLGQPVTFIDCP